MNLRTHVEITVCEAAAPVGATLLVVDRNGKPSTCFNLAKITPASRNRVTRILRSIPAEILDGNVVFTGHVNWSAAYQKYLNRCLLIYGKHFKNYLTFHQFTRLDPVDIEMFTQSKE